MKYTVAALLTLPLLASCHDDNEAKGNGSPTISAEGVSSALLGDSIRFTVNCADKDGIALSTLKAELCYGDEVVNSQTLRTKTDGDYDVELYAPYYKDIPDGTAQIRLTLQNTRLEKTVKNTYVEISRPMYEYVDLMASDGKTYRLTPDADNPYMFRTLVTSTTRNINGYIQTPEAGTDNNAQTFGLGTNGVTQEVQDNISFASSAAGTFEVWFDVKTYEYGPQSDIPVIELKDEDEANVYVGELTQNGVYEISGSDEFAKDSWYYDPDFFTRNEDGTFTFLALSGMYTIKADFTNGGFKIWAMADKYDTATMAEDGSGALWIIGSDCIGKPGYSQISGEGWWTDTDHALCMAEIKSKVYKITLTIGKQLKADGSEVNFKFYGQAGWDIEFKGTAGTYCISTDSDIFGVGDGTTEYQGGSDNGNIYLKNGVALTEGDTYVLTVDLTSGTANGKLTVAKQ